MGSSDYKYALEQSAVIERHYGTVYNEFQQFVSQYIKGRCLEIGCGDGIWTAFFRRHCSDLVSVDLSRENKKSKRKGR